MEGSALALIAGKGGAVVGGIFGLIIVLVAIVISIAIIYWGWKIAQKKGYSPWIGFLLAFFLGLIGIIILYVMPDKSTAKPLSAPMMGAPPSAPSPMGQVATPPSAPPTAAPAPPPAAPTPPAPPPTGGTPPAPPPPGV